MKNILALLIVLVVLPACSVFDTKVNNRAYVNTDINACKTIKFVCQPGEMPFFDNDKGCGCEKIEEGKKPTTDVKCADDYKPVCGFLNGSKQTYANFCLARKDAASDIVDGECK